MSSSDKSSLKHLFKRQKSFQKNLYKLEGITDEEKVALTKDFVLAAHQELSEVLECLNWKSHRKTDKPFMLSNLGEETIDVFKYLLNICILWGIDFQKFIEIFEGKSDVVDQRFRQEFMKAKEGQRVCALDLDDTLNEWELFFLFQYNQQNKTNYTSYEDLKKNENTLKIRKFKHWFRESGIKRDIPVKTGAVSITQYLKNKGYRIIIISSRPYKEYYRLFSDTIIWLKKHGIKYDDIYFEENKHLTILKKFPNLSFMVEDNIQFANEVAREGYKVYHLGKTGQWYPEHHKITRIDSLKDLKKYV